MKDAHKKAHESARPKLRPWCDTCKNIFSPSARKAGFTVCINCRKDNSWTSTGTSMRTLRYYVIRRWEIGSHCYNRESEKDMNYESIHGTAPAVVNVPKLTTAIRLVELSISVWSGRKQDKTATRDAAIASSADATFLNTTKKLLGDCEELEAVRKFAANARNFVYSSTSPWGDLGQRSFPMSKFPDFHREITGMQTEFDRLVTNFLSVYDYARTHVQAKLGALYNADEYPSPESLQDKFRFFFTYPPVPEANMYSQVQDEAEAYLRDEYARVYTDRINGMYGSVCIAP